MTADQIQAWAREADAYANAYGQYHAWDASFDKQAVRDAHFARLVGKHYRAAAFEEAIETCESIAAILLDASITAVEHTACSDRNDAMRCGAEDCADAIRALAAAEKEPT